ncbi:cation:proton antiporter [Colwellia sp. C1TZA3]|uniref:cation:proton antiporter n=1 Tax=Colwellia sp. C1TZA3 TaxID=2508879 RepID=UPI0011B9920B|nr:monovalent cation/H(+) antiporter subunit G [Colwellia sp. C1TZA3]TWX69092.1 monovalent cation/H(+) antiporter subunit G [Colwellia sp. C1TZA3]
MNLADSFSVIFCLAGLFFFFAGTVGLIRFPDVLSRLHALTKADNLGLGLIVIGLLPQLSSLTDGLKLVLVWGLVIFSSAACSYLIASQVINEQALKTPTPPSVEGKS